MNSMQRKPWRPHQPVKIGVPPVNNSRLKGLLRQQQINEERIEDKFDRLVKREIERQAATTRM